MKKFILIILSFLSVSAFAEILLIHEKQSGSDWVLGLTTIDSVDELPDAVAVIDADTTKRRGQNFRIFGGIRGTIEEVITPGVEIWSPAPAVKWLVFWNQLDANGQPTSDPADFFVAEFLDQSDADAYVNEVKSTATLGLWDERPFKVDTSYKGSLTPSTTDFRIAIP
tara:strand:+ start:1493 stop:1996 length:504 start_codon:yes stop_codon:yes gene_type:complete